MTTLPEKARVFGKETVDGHETWVVGAQIDEHTRQRVWFDATTGLAVRRLITVDSPVGRIPTQTDFDDYRDVNGVKVPFTVKVSSVNGGQNATRKYTSIELGKPVDEKLFEAPKAAVTFAQLQGTRRAPQCLTIGAMRGGQIDRVKRQLLRQAVADNLDTIRGLPPRSLRPSRRFARLFLRRAPLVIIPLMLASFAFLSNTGDHEHAQTPAIASPRTAAHRRIEASVAPMLMTDTLEPVSASAFPLVRPPRRARRRPRRHRSRRDRRSRTSARKRSRSTSRQRLQRAAARRTDSKSSPRATTTASSPLRERARLANGSQQRHLRLHPRQLARRTRQPRRRDLLPRRRPTIRR